MTRKFPPRPLGPGNQVLRKGDRPRHIADTVLPREDMARSVALALRPLCERLVRSGRTFLAVVGHAHSGTPFQGNPLR